MSLQFQSDHFVIKRKGISTEKLRIFNSQGDFLLYVEEKIKWTAPWTTTIRFYTDEQKQQEVLQVTDGHGNEYKNFLAVIDSATGQTIGGIGGDWDNFFTEAWAFLGADGNELAKVRETSTSRSILHTLTDGLIPQKVVVTIGEDVFAELRQKKVFVGSHLLVDIVPEASAKLDHRLLLAFAAVLAAYQAKTDVD